MNKKNTDTLRSSSPQIHRLLTQLRQKIRSHILLNGLAQAVIWFVLLGWLVLALDYLPVKFGWRELSIGSRVVAMTVIGLGWCWIVHIQILCKLSVRLPDESLALLIERRYPEFAESLVTVVSHFSNPDRETSGGNVALIELTQSKAETLVPGVQWDRVLHTQRLNWSLGIASALAISLIGISFANPTFMRLAGDRLIGLSNKTWPRMCQLQLVGLKILRENPVAGIAELGTIIEPEQGKFKIPRGASITLLARAEAQMPDPLATGLPQKIPSNCRMIYRSDDGDQGSMTMSRIGAPRDHSQLFSIDGQVLNDMFTNMSFEIQGGDNRIGPFQISVVDLPAVVETNLACEFPDYLVDSVSGRWTPREILWTGATKLPRGTRIVIRARSNKPIRTVYAVDGATQQTRSWPGDGNRFEIPLETLEQPIRQEIFLLDEDGVMAESPFVIAIDPIDDLPPIVQTSLVGIGTAITPQATIPFNGEVTDDYGVAGVWLEIDIPSLEPFQEPVGLESSGRIEGQLDLLQKKRAGNETLDLPTEAGSTISLIVKAADHLDLDANPNVGVSDKYVLDVVDNSQLLRILERQEVGQRRRLEQIYLELGDAQGFLQRTRFTNETAPGLDTSDHQDPATDSESADTLRGGEIQMLFAQRAAMQISKSQQEILGAANSFENIRLQLINNRIDSEDRKNRLLEQVEKPLREISKQLLPELGLIVDELKLQLAALQTNPENAAWLDAAKSRTNQADARIVAVRLRLNSVLESLVKYETHNELLELVREMIAEQQGILERTKTQRQENAFEGLLD